MGITFNPLENSHVSRKPCLITLNRIPAPPCRPPLHPCGSLHMVGGGESWALPCPCEAWRSNHSLESGRPRGSDWLPFGSVGGSKMSKPTTDPTFTGKLLTPRAAIRAHCNWCNGGNTKTCVSPACPLFAYRMTKVQPGDKASPLKSIRAWCLMCDETPARIHACTMFKPYLADPACPLWPYREGKRRVSPEYREQRREQAKRQLRESGPGATFASQEPAKEQS